MSFDMLVWCNQRRKDCGNFFGVWKRRLRRALLEDEFSGVPFRPENWRTDGRMYPPQEDSRMKCPEHPSLRKYRNKGHYNFIGSNGSIRIETLNAEILLDKPGQDGREAHDLDA